MLERLARWVIRRRWWVVAGWIVLFAIGLMLAPRIGDVTSNQVTLPGKESQHGIDLIEEHFGNGESSSLQVVYRNPNATVDDASFRDPVVAGLKRAAARGTTSVSDWARPPITTSTVGTPDAAVVAMRSS